MTSVVREPEADEVLRGEDAVLPSGEFGESLIPCSGHNQTTRKRCQRDR